MNYRPLVLMVLGGACALWSTSGCVLETDVGADTQNSSAVGGAGVEGGASPDGCNSGAASATGGMGGFSMEGAGGANAGGFSMGGAGGFGAGFSVGAGGASQMFVCGDGLECNVELTFCQITLPGLPGSEPTYECMPMPEECLSNPTCECVSPHVCGPSCGGCGQSCEVGSDGGITGTCALP